MKYVMRINGVERPAMYSDDPFGVAQWLAMLPENTGVNAYDESGSRNYLTSQERSEVARELVRMGGDPMAYGCLDIGR